MELPNIPDLYPTVNVSEEKKIGAMSRVQENYSVFFLRDTDEAMSRILTQNCHFQEPILSYPLCSFNILVPYFF